MWYNQSSHLKAFLFDFLCNYMSVISTDISNQHTVAFQITIFDMPPVTSPKLTPNWRWQTTQPILYPTHPDTNLHHHKDFNWTASNLEYFRPSSLTKLLSSNDSFIPISRSKLIVITKEPLPIASMYGVYLPIYLTEKINHSCRFSEQTILYQNPTDPAPSKKKWHLRHKVYIQRSFRHLTSRGREESGCCNSQRKPCGMAIFDVEQASKWCLPKHMGS